MANFKNILLGICIGPIAGLIFGFTVLMLCNINKEFGYLSESTSRVVMSIEYFKFFGMGVYSAIIFVGIPIHLTLKYFSLQPLWLYTTCGFLMGLFATSLFRIGSAFWTFEILVSMNMEWMIIDHLISAVICTTSAYVAFWVFTVYLPTKYEKNDITTAL